ncbi:hypothetical protein KAJ27_03970, partial [bacterium]|nr:hypothetical protein [bacterium]
MKQLLIIIFVIILSPMLNAQETGYDYIPGNVQGFAGFNVQEIHTSEIFQLSLTKDFDTIILAGSPPSEPFGIIKMVKNISYMKTFFAGNEIEVNGKTVYRDKTNKKTVFYFVSDYLLIVGKLKQITSVIKSKNKKTGFLKKYGYKNFVSASIKNSCAVISSLNIDENIKKLINKKNEDVLRMSLSKIDGFAASLKIKDSLNVTMGLIFKTEKLASSINDLLNGFAGTLSEV